MMTRVATQVRGVRSPVQRRSRRTLDRLLDAAEALLADRTFDQLTVADVVSRAGSSVGSFYARFPDKEALLGAIYERHQQQMIALLDEQLTPQRWADQSLGELIEQLVSSLVRLHRSRRGLLRALVLFGHTHPDWRYADERERSRLPVTRLGELIASRSAELTHPDPMAAAMLGVLTVLATLRETILFSESTSSAVGMTDNRLTAELSRQFRAYLGVKEKRDTAEG